MILPLLILVLLAGGLAAWALSRWSVSAGRWAALAALAVDGWLLLDAAQPAPSERWMAEFNQPWLPQLGIHFHLALDGLSLALIGLTIFLGAVSVTISWSSIRERAGFFHFNLMWILGGIVGVFLAMDLFLFFFFWELMIVPMYFLIAIWGHESKAYAAIKFFIFTQASGLLMLLSILGLYFAHGSGTGNYTFSYVELLEAPLPPGLSFWLMLGFFIAFAVKLPAVPFHTWLADAHTQAPTAGSVILAGLLLKTGAYGLLRFVLPLFPDAATQFATPAMLLGVVGILYGAKLAFAQTDLKRLVAYTSVSHMGFVLLGIFAWNQWALEGVVMQMVCHGISTGALFIIAGELQDRMHTRDMDKMGGLWAKAPRLSAIGLFFAIVSLGLPGFGNFIGEFLILLGAFKMSPLAAILAALGLVLATAYSLRLVQRAFHGENRWKASLPDFGMREMAVMSALMASILWLGLHPQPLLNLARPALENARKAALPMAAAPAAAAEVTRRIPPDRQTNRLLTSAAAEESPRRTPPRVGGYTANEALSAKFDTDDRR